MKNHLAFSILLLSSEVIAFGQSAVASKPIRPRELNYSIVEAGPHHRIWQSIDANGQEHKITELGTGVNYWDGEQWTPSVATFVATNDGFVALQLQQQVDLAA